MQSIQAGFGIRSSFPCASFPKVALLHFGEDEAVLSKKLPPLSTILKGQYLEWAKKRKVDSLETLQTELKNVNNENARFFINLGKACRAQGKEFWPYAKRIAQTLAEHPLLSDEYKAYGFICLGNLLKAPKDRQTQYEKALLMACRSGVLAVICEVYLAMAIAQLPNKKEYLANANEFSKTLNDPVQQARIQLAIGQEEEDVPTQRIHFSNAATLAEQGGNYAVSAYANIALGNSFRGDEQIPYFEKAMTLGEILKSDMIQAKAMLGLGRVRGISITLREQYLNKALGVGMEKQDSLIQTQAYLALGHLYANEKNDNSNALLWYSEAERCAPNNSLRDKALKGINQTRSRL